MPIRMLVVLQSIVSYRTQFSFVILDVCHKWDIMVRKDLRAKAGLLYDFFSKVEAATATKKDVLSILDSNKFSEICNSLLKVWSDCIEVYTDESLRGTSSVKAADGAATYFLAVNTDIEIKITELLSSMLTELQAMVLALKCVPSFCSVVLYSNSQSAIDACISEASSTTLDFHNHCWIERLQIVNLLRDKNISIKWVKIKGHSDVLGNVKTDVLAKRFLVTEKTAISGNVCHFARDLHQSICCVYWEAGLSFDIVPNVIVKDIDWDATATIWHPDLHMFSGFTNRKSANLHTYLIKTVYKQLLVVVRKRLYNRGYPGVLCLLCGKIEFFDHAFTCSGDSGLHGNILVEAAEK
ncbi:hypothetical protein G9A89_002922 [Geosiphon pyriformis]|nr:hypothetical protein G9A89_002922 [Geosiphon pyriformis]